MEDNLVTSPFFGWADIAWIIAALLGIWGVMLGVEEFALANFFMILAGLICAWRLGRDCFQDGKRQWAVFVVCCILIGAFVTGDIVLTHRKQKSSKARDEQIPALQKTIEHLTEQLVKTQASAAQKVDDIQSENKKLRTSIEQKDAALVSIAKEQLELNYAPEFLITTQNSLDTLLLQNIGKTNIQLLDMTVQTVGHVGGISGGPGLPETIAPTGSATFGLSQLQQAAIKRHQIENTNEVSYTCGLLISTMNSKHYRMSFTLTFDIKDDKVTKSFATDGPIVSVKR